jgi:hypothetical protein
LETEKVRTKIRFNAVMRKRKNNLAGLLLKMEYLAYTINAEIHKVKIINGVFSISGSKSFTLEEGSENSKGKNVIIVYMESPSKAIEELCHANFFLVNGRSITNKVEVMRVSIYLMKGRLPYQCHEPVLWRLKGLTLN